MATNKRLLFILPLNHPSAVLWILGVVVNMHGVNENLPMSPSSHTISSVASDVSFEDLAGVNMDTRSASGSSTSTLRRHPTLFIEDDMVRVQVCI
jgi:hypothetical protein